MFIESIYRCMFDISIEERREIAATYRKSTAEETHQTFHPLTTEGTNLLNTVNSFTLINKKNLHHNGQAIVIPIITAVELEISESNTTIIQRQGEEDIGFVMISGTSSPISDS